MNATFPNAPELAAALAALRAAYAAALPGKIRDLEGAWEALAAGRGDARALYRLAHNLVGSSGTYGFPAVEPPAAAIEAIAKSCAEVGTFPSDADLARVPGLLAEIRTASLPN
jgi:hypothetical protein